MLTDEQIYDAINAAPLAQGPQTFVLAVGRAIERAVLQRACQFEGVLFEHADGRRAVTSGAAPSPEWHRAGPCTVYLELAK